MIEIDYKFIQELFEVVWKKTNFNAFVFGLKGITIAFLLIRYIYIFAKNTLQQKTVSFGESQVQLPINVYNLIYYGTMAGLIAAYDHLLFGLDAVLGYFISYFYALDIQTIAMNLDEGGSAVPQDIGHFEALKLAALEILKILNNPTLLILYTVKAFVWLFDLIIYGIFIAERFFVLLILKITGPIAICLSLLPKMGNMFGKWLSIYFRWYLLIIPYLLVNLVINGFLEGYSMMFQQFGSGTSVSATNIKTTLEVPLFLFLAFLKFTLYRTGKSIYNELIDINLNKEED